MNIREKIYTEFTYFDGGYGTMFQAMGLKPGEKPELWNITSPDKVVSIHEEYLRAGAEIIKTNTFGANLIRFPEGRSDYTLKDIVESAIANAEAAKTRANAPNAYIALSVGPTGKLLKPLGDLDFEEAVAIFRKTIDIGVSRGVDLILIETMNDIYEAKAAIIAAKESCTLPIFLTCAFDETDRLLTGATPETVVVVAEALGVTALGANCSVGPDKMADVIKRMGAVASVPIICNPNAGLPKVENGRTYFTSDPESFSGAFDQICHGGAVILGGCCGTTPEHIRKLVEKTSDFAYKAPEYKNNTVIASYNRVVELGDRPVLIGERINPTGKKRFKEALENRDINYILGEGLAQVEKGAHVLDVNVGLPGIDEAGLMRDVIMELQSIIDLPLQIDTPDTTAMETALRIYNGKPMINSVNGKEEVMEQVFPLAAKYGGLVVALTLDEDGIPDTPEKRAEIARKIVEKAETYGIAPKNIIVDPLCMSISADKSGGDVTLRALDIIGRDMKLKTCLGVSNISFGLPRRDIINGIFFALAMERGLSAAIMNPACEEMMKAYHGFLALKGLDGNCLEYIDYASALPMASTVSAPVGNEKAAAVADKGDRDPLIDSIIKGLKEQAGLLTEEYLADKPPMTLIDEYLITALDIVGQGFEDKRIFLPQLLMSAEAAGAAFEVIKGRIVSMGGQGEKKASVILATVRGDVHDIGKNIVKVLLENYGYDVIDLGKDVPPELIVKEAKARKVPLIGLSALMTTTVPSMEETIRLLRAEGVTAKVCVGGAVMTKEYADMIGADKYARDAMETVRYAEELTVRFNI